MLGSEILRQRIEKKYTIQEVVNLTGVTFSTICNLELQKSKFITEENFEKLSKIFQLQGYEMYIYRKGGALLGAMIRKARLEKGYTQQELAFLCGYKSKRSIGQLECGRYHKITNTTFQKLKQFLPLDEKEFQPFIQKEEVIQDYNRISFINRKKIQQLVCEKRADLHLTRMEVSTMAGVSLSCIARIERHPEIKVYPNKIACLMRALGFTDEEINDCIDAAKEDGIKQKQKKKTSNEFTFNDRNKKDV